MQHVLCQEAFGFEHFFERFQFETIKVSVGQMAHFRTTPNGCCGGHSSGENRMPKQCRELCNFDCPFAALFRVFFLPPSIAFAAEEVR